MKRLAAVAGLFGLLLVGGAVAILVDRPRAAAGASIALWVLHRVVNRIRRGPWYWRLFKRELFGKRETMQVLLRTVLGMAGFGLADLPVAGALVGTYVGARVLALNFLTPVYNRTYKSSILAAGLADVEQFRATFRAFDTTSSAWMTQVRRLRSLVRDVEPVGWALVFVGAESELLASWIAAVPAALAIALAAATIGHFWIARSRRVFQVAERQLLDSLGTYAPEAVVYFSAPNGKSVYQVAQWMPILQATGRRFVVITRERALRGPLAAVSPFPVVWVPRLADLDRVAGGSTAAFYVNNGMKNLHMLRLSRLHHVQLLHGESDKGSSASKSAGAYDSLFVAGQLAVDRYARAGVNIAPEKFVIVGRPMVDGLQPPRDDRTGRPVVLYAPTWEGFDRSSTSCSVVRFGEAMVTALLQLEPPVTVLFKPHPLTGSEVAQYGAAVAAIRATVEAAAADDPSAGHQVVDRTVPINDCFDRSDLLISDVSSVIVDYLATGKPMVVCDAEQLGSELMHETYPTTGGALIITEPAQVAAAVVSSLADDPMQRRRAATRAYVLGPFRGDAQLRINAVIDAIVSGDALPPLPQSPSPQAVEAAPFLRCPICGSLEVSVLELSGKAGQRVASECAACGFVGFEWNGTTRPNRAPNDRLGSADQPGRDLAMAEMGLQLLGGTARVVVVEPGVSHDIDRIRELTGVTSVEVVNDGARVASNGPGPVLVLANEVVQAFADPVAGMSAIADMIGESGLAVLSTDVRDGASMESAAFPFVPTNRWYWSPEAIAAVAERHGLRYDARRPQVGVSKRLYRKRYILLSRSPRVMQHVRTYFGDHFAAPSEAVRKEAS